MLNTSVLKIDQVEVFRLQFQQLVQRCNKVECHGDKLILDDFEIILDRNRIIKKRGYEILLMDVQELNFSCDNDLSVSFSYKERLINYTFKIK